MRITLFGATGMTGREVLDLSLRDGHQVSALVRDPTAIPRHDNLRVIVGDAPDPVAVGESLAVADAALSCLGVGGTGDGRPSTFVSTATGIITEQMRQQAVDRLVVMSNVGASGSGTWVARHVVYPLFTRWLVPIIDDKTRMEQTLAASNLTWTSVRLPDITTGGPKPPHISMDGRRLRPWVSVATTARFLLDTVTTGAFPRQAPAISH